MTETSRPQRMASWLEDAWLQRYLHRELTADESEWFEAYVLDKPDLVDRIEQDTDLRDVLASAADADWAARGSASPASGRSRPGWVPAFALAATLALGVGVGRFALDPGADAEAVADANPIRYFVDTDRGAALAPSVDHADSASHWAIVDIGLPPTATDVSVSLGDGRRVRLVAGQDGVVTFVAEHALLQRHPVLELRYSLEGRTEVQQIDLAGRSRP